MAKVAALAGIFYKVRDPAATRAWYEQNLKVPVSEYGWECRWREHAGNGTGYTVWSPFAQDTDYFAPSHRSFLINLRIGVKIELWEPST